jgi:glycosyltransferase involved in cell wall biosynthesis
MQEEPGLVSVIIPVYKTGIIINETIQSVLKQTYSRFEIIAIDDGSDDNTMEEIARINDPRIKIFRQENQGMAQTRNNGLKISRGEFVLFLDHDDILESGFIEARVDCFARQAEVGFVGGAIKIFPGESADFLSVAINVEEELLFFAPQFLTTPSSYLIRKRVLTEGNIKFNTKLSSTADRYLLLQLAKVTRGARVNEGKLLYRISPGGFSQILKPSLVIDNEQFFKEIKKNGLMPQHNRQKFKSLYFFMLAGGFRKIGYWHKTMFYMIRSFLSSPEIFLKRLRNVSMK